MLRFLRIERPTMATFRPTWIATSIACCIRWTLDANETTRIRPLRSGISVRNASPTSRSEPVIPGRSAFVESPSIRSTPRFPSSASRPTSVLSPSTGVWSSFQSPVCTTRPAAVSRTIATQSGIECATRTKSSVNEPTRICFPVSASSSCVEAVSPCSSSFDLIKPERQLRRDHLVAVHLAEQIRQPTDVVLVPVREDDRVDAAVAQVADVRQDEVDAEMLVPGEREARIDDDDLVAMLVNSHVLADLAEAAQWDDPQAHARSVRAASF